MTETTPRKAAVIAGIGYVALFVLAIFANFFVREGLVVAGDAGATFENIAESESLFRAGMAAFLIIFLLDIVVAWALHIVFRTVDRTTSLLAAWFRIVYTVFLGVAAVFLFAAAHLVGDSPVLDGLAAEQLATPVALLMDAFNYTWLIGLAAFGVHLAILGAMILRSLIASRFLGVMLIAAGAAYMMDTFAHALIANYAAYADAILVVVATTAVIAEFAFMIWLFRSAGKAATTASPSDDSSGANGSINRDEVLVRSS
ncbi:MAG TPA: DUF4386 domain-containing protein [Acidimicrobiia bacterium]|jgi:hypothetical protein|nr:DUF4386 domain-containing protein [Acidimicrobiia bacterium]